MILQALAKYYDDMLSRGEISAPGWGKSKVNFALCLDENGNITDIVSLLVDVTVGKKTVKRPQMVDLPLTAKAGSSISPNFIWDNSTYFFGVDKKGKPKRSIECFEESKKFHHEMLDEVNSITAKAILAFFDSWNPEKALENQFFAAVYDEVVENANLVFRVCGRYAHEDKEIREAWQNHYNAKDGVKMQCLITGKEDTIEATHPFIKGVKDAQSSGAAIVSFNAPAFCSYGHEQNYNAPVGSSAAFAYTTAINHLLADKSHVQYIGDATVVFWADGAEPEYSDFACSALFGNESSNNLSDDDISAALKRLSQGLPCEELGLDPQKTFYILGLAPSAARISVRFFLKNSFGKIMKNVNDHNERMKIKKSFENDPDIIPLWAMLRETVNLNSKNKSPSPAMAGATARAIFSGTRYPASLLESVMLRIRAESKVNRTRAAIIKAYYLKNENKDCPKEVLTVSLNENSTNVAYTLGRLFSVYEAVQQAANPGINATIKDKYFNSAAARPASIFPILGNLSQKHLRKLEKGTQIYFDRQISELKAILGEEYPQTMNLAKQGSFDLGYYHQTQFRYTKKEDK